MGNELDELETLTISVADKLQEMGFEEIAAFVEERDALMERIRSKEEQEPFLTRSSKQVERILQHDHAIMGRMLELKNEATDALVRMDQGKKQKSAYEAAYSHDSYFFDRRK